jgi:hypothetical protein
MDNLQEILVRLTGYRVSIGKPRSLRPAPKIRPHVDLRAVTSDPIEAVYRAGHSCTSNPNQWVIINVPVERTRRFPMGFAEDSRYPDPYAATIRDYLDGTCVSYEGSALEKFYAAWQPGNAAVLLGLERGEAHESLLAAPAFGAVWPWDFDSPEERTRMNDGGEWWLNGPVGAASGRVEFAKHQQIADSIVMNGYRRNTDDVDGDIAAHVLVRGDDWRILVVDGNHRYSALRATNWRTIPVCFRRWPMILRREDVRSWPNVANSIFGVEAALKIFDACFDARQPLAYCGYGLNTAS